MSILSSQLESSATSSSFRGKFSLDDFETVIRTNGYPVWYFRANVCPCKNDQTNLSVCNSCRGDGIFFSERLETKMLIQHFSQTKKFHTYTDVLSGTVTITAFSTIGFTYGDRVTVLGTDSIFAEVLNPTDGVLRATYPVVEILDIFQYNRETKTTVKFEGEYSITEINGFDISIEGVPAGESISIRYKHLPTFFVKGFNREVLTLDYLTPKLDTERGPFPVSVVAERLHFARKLKPNDYHASAD